VEKLSIRSILEKKGIFSEKSLEDVKKKENNCGATPKRKITTYKYELFEDYNKNTHDDYYKKTL
jgi:hypothetical protein